MADRSLESVAQHVQAGRLEQARGALARMLQRSARDANANAMMAAVLGRMGQLEQAAFYGRRAVEVGPGSADAHFNLGHILSQLGRHEEAGAAFGRAADLRPADPAARSLQAAALSAAYQLADALAATDRGLAMFPGDAELLATRARVLLLLGRAGEAVAALRSGLAAHPESIGLARRLAFAAVYDPTTEPDALLELHRGAGELLSRAVPDRPAAIRDADPDRPLRIGFISADLCSHVVAMFLFPILMGLDRREFAVACYSTAPREDAVSRRLASLAQAWRHVAGMGPEDLAARIRADGIDILIELGGYSGEPVIDAMAYRPAPVQATYLGYPCTTGFDRIDCRLVDSLTDPAEGPDRADGLAVEKLVRLDPCFLCYRPPGEGLPEPRPGGAPGRGTVMFGSFNAFQKINAPLLRMWGRILEATPGSRLTLKNMGFAQSAARVEFAGRLVEAGIDPGRVTLQEPTDSFADHLRAYEQIDISLDTYPYCGTTTTCEALFMGVPVVSLSGKIHASRVGLSLLSAAGLAELAATSEEGYIRIASELAADRGRLARLRAGLRERLLAGPLCDGPAFCARFGGALRRLWRERCVGR